MIYEFENIIKGCLTAVENHQKVVMASVVALEGSSYRRPGVRMLLREDGVMEGAVSGGCVEREVFRQAQSVFETGIPKIMTYDGRFRLGCEGILYILIEPLQLSQAFIERFDLAVERREHLVLRSGYEKKVTALETAATRVEFNDGKIMALRERVAAGTPAESFSQELAPSLRLLIVGAEHDAEKMSRAARFAGWQPVIVAPADDARSADNFPVAFKVINTTPEHFDMTLIDKHTAVLLMTHSYVTDFKYLLRLHSSELTYLGILGPVRRRERLFGDLMDQCDDLDPAFLEKIHGPAGLHLGAETPEEIAISVVAEILSVVRQQTVMPLKDKKGRIHENVKW
ncbi:XdhC family protein [Robertkochia sediminum]|uniref:XdhC family protein n=1 Tax=Robertkochia sediminum TaxID=2785326 RepID=UPI001933D747|nr:XdhC/CoxI family protein [Robertkochia sediminum]MBL7473026.1 XdhC family protein [Robertkochia sediminum]